MNMVAVLLKVMKKPLNGIVSQLNKVMLVHSVIWHIAMKRVSELLLA